MSVSTAEMQELLNRLFELLGEKNPVSGQVVIHFADQGQYKGCEVNKVHRPTRVLSRIQ